MIEYGGNIPEPTGSLDNLPASSIYGRGITDGTPLPAHPDRLPEHGVTYPTSFLDEPIRDLLRKSQIDVTPEPLLGERYAAAAYDRASRNNNLGTDFGTAAGEAAAKAGFCATQAGKPDEHIEAWFQRSKSALAGPGEARERERIATDLLHARSLSLRAVSDPNSRRQWDNEGTQEHAASWRFEYADFFLKRQHVRAKTWDRYATMTSRHWATHEAVFGHRNESAKIALDGVWRAVRAHKEKPDDSPEASRLDNFTKHVKFVGKQVLANTTALALAVTQPRKENSRWASRHRAIAAKMLD